MFAACILFALPTIKDEWVKADTHPVYNSRVYGIGEPRDPLQALFEVERKIKIRIRQADLIAQKAKLELDLLNDEDKLDLAVKRMEAAEPMPDDALLTKLQKQITDLRDSMAVTRKKLAEVEKEIVMNR